VADLGQIASRFLKAHGVDPTTPIVVACSGGPDSTALAHTCAVFLRRLTLAYIDHGLRPDSAADGATVAELARRIGAAAVAETVEVDRSQASLEDAARRARYAALDRIAERVGARFVLTGHTASDQAETVLMRLLRGTGIRGLAGIPPRRDRYLRPLLGVTRAEVEAYLGKNDLAAAHDPTNRDLSLTRNRVRHRWLPALQAENPAVEQALCRLAESAREQAQVLDFAALQVPMTVAALAVAPAPVAKRALALAAERAGAGPLSARHQEALLALVTRPCRGTAELALPGVWVYREYDELRFTASDPSRDRARGGPAAFALEDQALDVQGPDGPYLVRGWRPGDRMRPRRLRGRSRKLSDLFIDAKVPRAQRANARVVVRAGDGVIVWAEHVGPAYATSISVTLTQGVAVATNKK
jgi:tRNA(Ile)-lysidine synthase